MSIATCANCGDVFDTDFQMNTNNKGECICDDCYEDYCCENCGEELSDEEIKANAQPCFECQKGNI